MRIQPFTIEPHIYSNITYAEQLEIIRDNIDGFFLFMMGIMIKLMEIGFGYLEAGSVSAKNATNVMFKNMLDSLLSAFLFWLFSYTLAFGNGNCFIGLSPYIAGQKLGENHHYAHWFFHISYASTPATIVSAAVVGRITFPAYIIYSALITGVVYPIVCHWAWTTEGWLYIWDYKDVGGSGVVHVTGGTCAIVAALMLGPRIGRFPPKGTVLTPEELHKFQSHNTLKAGLGIMIVFTGFFAFNGGAVISVSKPGDSELIAKVMINTWLACCGSSFGALIIVRLGLQDGVRRWSFIHAMNAGLAGMVATAAQGDFMEPWASLVNGALVSIIYCCVAKLVIKLKIDDPVNVIAAHWGGGLWGASFATLLRNDSLASGITDTAGVYLYKNIVGVLAIITWSSVCSIIIFGSLKLAKVLRTSPEHELAGDDMSKHLEPAYNGLPCSCDGNKHFIPASHRNVA